MSNIIKKIGRILPAPENFVDIELAHEITTKGVR